MPRTPAAGRRSGADPHITRMRTFAAALRRSRPEPGRGGLVSAGSGTGTGSSRGTSPATIWAVSAVCALLHVSLLTLVAGHTGSPAVFYVVMAAPAVVAALLHPADTLRRSYRWLSVYLIVLTSMASTVALLVGEVWLIRRTWVENAGRPVPLLRTAQLRRPGAPRSGHTRPVHD